MILDKESDTLDVTLFRHRRCRNKATCIPKASNLPGANIVLDKLNIVRKSSIKSTNKRLQTAIFQKYQYLLSTQLAQVETDIRAFRESLMESDPCYRAAELYNGLDQVSLIEFRHATNADVCFLRQYIGASKLGSSSAKNILIECSNRRKHFDFVNESLQSRMTELDMQLNEFDGKLNLEADPQLKTVYVSLPASDTFQLLMFQNDADIHLPEILLFEINDSLNMQKLIGHAFWEGLNSMKSAVSKRLEELDKYYSDVHKVIRSCSLALLDVIYKTMDEFSNCSEFRKLELLNERIILEIIGPSATGSSTTLLYLQYCLESYQFYKQKRKCILQMYSSNIQMFIQSCESLLRGSLLCSDARTSAQPRNKYVSTQIDTESNLKKRVETFIENLDSIIVSIESYEKDVHASDRRLVDHRLIKRFKRERSNKTLLTISSKEIDYDQILLEKTRINYRNSLIKLRKLDLKHQEIYNARNLIDQERSLLDLASTVSVDVAADWTRIQSDTASFAESKKSVTLPPLFPALGMIADDKRSRIHWELFNKGVLNHSAAGEIILRLGVVKPELKSNVFPKNNE